MSRDTCFPFFFFFYLRCLNQPTTTFFFLSFSAFKSACTIFHFTFLLAFTFAFTIHQFSFSLSKSCRATSGVNRRPFEARRDTVTATVTRLVSFFFFLHLFCFAAAVWLLRYCCFVATSVSVPVLPSSSPELRQP